MPTISHQDFSKELIGVMLRERMRVEELADRVGVPVATISDLINGINLPDESVLGYVLSKVVCCGMCLTGYDIGVGGAGIAYPHPECALHGEYGCENYTSRANSDNGEVCVNCNDLRAEHILEMNDKSVRDAAREYANSEFRLYGTSTLPSLEFIWKANGYCDVSENQLQLDF